MPSNGIPVHKVLHVILSVDVPLFPSRRLLLEGETVPLKRVGRVGGCFPLIILVGVHTTLVLLEILAKILGVFSPNGLFLLGSVCFSGDHMGLNAFYKNLY